MIALSPRSHAYPSRSRPAHRLQLPALACAVLALAVAACGTPTGSGSPVATPDDRSAPPAASGSGAVGPKATPWTGNAVLGIEALGAADPEIRQAINDFNAGVQAGDLALMRQAALGLSDVDVLLPNVDRIEPFEPMRDFAARYRVAITQMAEASRELRAAIDAGDGPGTTEASRTLVDSFTRYAEIQAQLAGWVSQIPDQKRLLLR